MQLVEYGHILDKIKESSFIVIDKVILDHYPDINEILKGPKYEVYVVENPEQAKNLVDFEKICTTRSRSWFMNSSFKVLVNLERPN